ncbi:hypothetical protein [Thioalkalivibrio paradoxus]|uniref:Uncharacterized protein n=1 Tax=Thioalkalivibrio paradoxus ARh 1 TaxID=713585 RepID=W0DN52_9GAMM|nr:hypothetical protein [Thioalkalivibrio paradoxus]AHE99886.1 hypothetical protein THITH_03045 [Thioalkalivibrio paradoxus ARh 1]
MGWLYPLALAALFLALAGLAPPAFLREGLLGVFLVVILLAASTRFIRSAPASAARNPGSADLVVIAVMAVVLSSLYWVRAASGVSAWDTIGLRAVTMVGWWLPAVAFAALYHHPQEPWLRRGRFIARLGVAAIASIAAFPIQHAWNQEQALRAERAGLPGAVEALANRTLPPGARMDFQHEAGVLLLEVAWPEQAFGNYRSLASLRALAGDAAPMRPGGADRLTERVNVDRVHLQVRRGDVIIAEMEWPQPGLARGAQALAVDYDAAGLSRTPSQADLAEVLERLPSRFRTGELCARGSADTVHIQRCEQAPAPVLPHDIRVLEANWNEANSAMREIARVFPAVSAFTLALAGHSLEIPRDVVAAPGFDARTLLPVPSGTLLVQVADTPEQSTPAVEPTGAPVMLLWRDGRWGPRRNQVALWPWQSGQLPAAQLRIHLLEVSDAGRVRLILESLNTARATLETITLEPGEALEWESVHLHHLGWIPGSQEPN